jgi:hypothetical protein
MIGIVNMKVKLSKNPVTAIEGVHLPWRLLLLVMHLWWWLHGWKRPA